MSDKGSTQVPLETLEEFKALQEDLLGFAHEASSIIKDLSGKLKASTEREAIQTEQAACWKEKALRGR